MKLPEQFIQLMQVILREEVSEFQNELNRPAPTSISLNPQKQAVFREGLSKVAWNSRQGIYLNERPIFTLDPKFHGGAYYVQEASSMFIAEIIRQITIDQKPQKVLDLCAAPGGKSTLLLANLPKGSVVLCNEVIKSRYQILRENLIKWGATNYVISNHDVSDLQNLANFFDIILVDAPCSGEGLFRKDKRAIQEWSIENVHRCSARQKRILGAAIDLLRPGGHLIYSTCTYNNYENEGNAQWLTQNFELDQVEIQLPKEWNIEKRRIGYQFYPHRVNGEGLYASIFQYNGDSLKEKDKDFLTFGSGKLITNKQRKLVYEWIKSPEQYTFIINNFGEVFGFPHELVKTLKTLDNLLKRKKLAVFIGTFKREQFVPSHDLALSQLVSDNVPKVDVDLTTALTFLRKETITVKSVNFGWHLIAYRGVHLGWIKILKNRVNNYYPKNWRIRMDILP